MSGHLQPPGLLADAAFIEAMCLAAAWLQLPRCVVCKGIAWPGSPGVIEVPWFDRYDPDWKYGGHAHRACQAEANWRRGGALPLETGRGTA